MMGEHNNILTIVAPMLSKSTIMPDKVSKWVIFHLKSKGNEIFNDMLIEYQIQNCLLDLAKLEDYA